MKASAVHSEGLSRVLSSRSSKSAFSIRRLSLKPSRLLISGECCSFSPLSRWAWTFPFEGWTVLSSICGRKLASHFYRSMAIHPLISSTGTSSTGGRFVSIYIFRNIGNCAPVYRRFMAHLRLHGSSHSIQSRRSRLTSAERKQANFFS